MIPEHYIQWVALGDHRGLWKSNTWARSGPGTNLPSPPGDRVKAAAYAYCRLWGLSDTMSEAPLPSSGRRGLFLRYGFPSVTCW